MTRGRIESQFRAELVDELDRLGRRLGLASTMRNKLAAELAGMHPTDWLALDLLSSVHSSTIGELGRQLDLSPAAATGLVDRLEGKGLVERRSDPHDRRRISVHSATGGPVGSNAMLAFYSDVRDAMATHANRFSTDELQVVVRFLEGASAALQHAVAEHRP